MPDVEMQSDHAFRAWLRGLNAVEVRLDRAAGLTAEELQMVAASREDTAA